MYKTLKTLVQIVQNYCFSLLNMQISDALVTAVGVDWLLRCFKLPLHLKFQVTVALTQQSYSTN